MDNLLRTSLKLVEKIDYKKYGWVLTTASIVALIFYQRGKDEDQDDQKQKKDQKQNEANQKKQDENKSEQSKQGQEKNDAKRNEEQKKNQPELKLNQQNQSKQPTNLQSLKDQKMQLIQQNLKKQIQELDKKQKKSNVNSSSSSLLRSSKGKYTNKQAFDEEQPNQQTSLQNYAFSDIESRQNLQIRNQINLKKQRKYTTDVDEPSNSYKRNQLLKIAKDQNPNDGLFFQVLASLAENEDEYE